ncbi:unnamed protein product [Darwinula stevensoni]|uniref:Brix domain-containing protein n=1 Tax=Darwinula stevensoni TaxID=69355 RepID=A0A7R8XDF2_9CRUS|nr:unnamed protein product [Darwinula stevensoni]CAG0894678.1 unnamed protein product [Darwinula stevensoni]
MKGRYVKKQKALAETESEEVQNAPHSFVIHRGKVSVDVKTLEQDLRSILEPFTASKLKSRKNSHIKDYVTASGIFHVSHLLILSQTELGVNLKVCRLPAGPTLTFRVKRYCLGRDVRSCLKRQVIYDGLLLNPPLLILSGLSEDINHELLMAKAFQNLFPPLSIPKMEVKKMKRVLLIHKDAESGELELRHFAVRLAPVAGRPIKKLTSNHVPNLAKYDDVADFVLKSGQLSESEGEADDPSAQVTLPEGMEVKGQIGSAKQSAVRLTEIGPRITLQLMKVESGLLTGEVLFHATVVKSAEDRERIRRLRDEKKRLKLERKRKQAENLKRKQMLEAEAKKQKEKELEAEEDDDVAWYRQEVGEEPDPDLLSKKRKWKRRGEVKVEEEQEDEETAKKKAKLKRKKEEHAEWLEQVKKRKQLKMKKKRRKK